MTTDDLYRLCALIALCILWATLLRLSSELVSDRCSTKSTGVTSPHCLAAFKKCCKGWSYPGRLPNHDQVGSPNFSRGVRGCLGWQFAIIEMQVITATLLENFEFSLPLQTAEHIIRKPLVLMVPMVEGIQYPWMGLKVKRLKRKRNGKLVTFIFYNDKSIHQERNGLQWLSVPTRLEWWSFATIALARVRPVYNPWYDPGPLKPMFISAYSAPL
ncbi:hypothetical protein EDB89DRAFT_2156136 [Lactarius sanguifluus]|nr:hypothetical protein EDB89DRAFT_2156136 [Lactarius sanguifluus]